jgi:arginine decarboxylase-like protein
LNELTKLNSKPPPKETDTSNQEHANQASLDDLEKHLSQLNEGISITDRGTMIQQVHLAIFRDWNALGLEQKRSAVSLMKKLVADWQEKYRVKMSLMDAVVTDLKDMPPETVCKSLFSCPNNSQDSLSI